MIKNKKFANLNLKSIKTNFYELLKKIEFLTKSLNIGLLLSLA
jgi:hypothetical protein